MIRKTLAGGAVLAAVVGAYATHGYSSAGEPARDIPVRCVEHVNHEGDASVGHCRTLSDRAQHLPYAMRRNCQNPNDMNCYARDPGDGGVAPHFRVIVGHDVCVLFSGTHRYAARHDYCTHR